MEDTPKNGPMDSDKFSLELKLRIDWRIKPNSVTIFDAMGGNVHHHRWKEGADGYRWDASSYASGIYFYRFQFSEGSDISGKIVLLR